MRNCQEHDLCLRALICILLATVFSGGALRGQLATSERPLSETALAIAPKDAAFFTTSVNLKSSWQTFLSSEFVSEIRQVPYVQRVMERIQEELNSDSGPGAGFKKALQDPNVKNLIAVAQDMFTDEVFVIGGQEWCKFGDGFSEFQNGLTEAMAEGEEAIQQYILDLDKDKIAQIPIPTMILGFRLAKDEHVRTQLDALEGILRIAGASNQQIKPLLAGLKRSDLKNGQILAFSVSTDSIPWDAIPMEGMGEEQRKLLDHVIALLKDRKITLSLGVIDNRLMMALSESGDVLKRLGEGDKLLSHPRLQKLVASPPKELRNVAYASADWREAGYRMNFDKYFRRLSAQMTKPLKEQLDENALSEKWLAQIRSDADFLDEKMAKMVADFDAQLSYSFAIEDGLEGHAYDWSPGQFLVNAKPLSIIRHAGKNSLLMFAIKQQWPAQLREIFEAALERVPDHLKYLMESGLLDDDEAKKAELVVTKVWPLVSEGYGILRDKVMPSLDDHEGLLSIAANWTITNLGEGAPPSDEPLPLPEIAGACKLKHKDQFINGCADMLNLMEKVVELVREIEPDSIPAGYHVPSPQEEELAGATRYYYDLPLDETPFQGAQLQLIVGSETLIYGYSTRQIRDMLENKPLSTRPAWLSDDKPVAALAYVDFAGICAAIKPWIRYGLTTFSGDLEEPLAERGDVPIPTGTEVLEIWDCFHRLGRTTGTTHINDDGSSFSRWVWVGK